MHPPLDQEFTFPSNLRWESPKSVFVFFFLCVVTNAQLFVRLEKESIFSGKLRDFVKKFTTSQSASARLTQANKEKTVEQIL